MRADDDLNIIIRPLGRARGEAEFVYETTLKVRWPRREGVSWHAWEAKHGSEVDECMEHGRAIVATSSEVIVGFALWRKDVLAMLYVKAGLRGNGVGLRLLAEHQPGGRRIIFASPDATVTGGPPFKVIQPTPCWKKWSAHHGLTWELA